MNQKSIPKFQMYSTNILFQPRLTTFFRTWSPLTSTQKNKGQPSRGHHFSTLEASPVWNGGPLRILLIDSLSKEIPQPGRQSCWPPDMMCFFPNEPPKPAFLDVCIVIKSGGRKLCFSCFWGLMAWYMWCTCVYIYIYVCRWSVSPTFGYSCYLPTM